MTKHLAGLRETVPAMSYGKPIALLSRALNTPVQDWVNLSHCAKEHIL